MKKSVILFLILCAVLPAGCGTQSPTDVREPDSNEIETESTADVSKSESSESVPDMYITALEARSIIQTWLDGHPLQPPVVLALENEEYTEDGEVYYLFSPDDMERYWLNFLVHRETGELFYMMISDGEEVLIEIEPLDDWYNRFYSS